MMGWSQFRDKDGNIVTEYFRPMKSQNSIDLKALTKKKKDLARTRWEGHFEAQLKFDNINGYEREYRMFKDRRFRFDFAWPDKKIAVEIHGGIYSGGRHTTGKGFENDREKMNLAIVDGWRVFEFTPKTVKEGTGILMLKKML